MKRWTHYLAAAGTSIVAVTFPAMALADTPGLSINTGSGWTQTSTSPLFNISQILPGWTDSRTFLLRNDSSTSGPLYVNAADIVEDENGCVPSEALVDTTCAPADGELGHALRFSIYVDPENDGTFESTPRWMGSVYDILSPTLLVSDLPAGKTWGIRIDGSLPLSTSNVTQSDEMGFDFALTTTGIGTPGTPGTPGTTGQTSGSVPTTGPGSVSAPQGPGSVVVEGIKHTRHQDHSVLRDIAELPFTGDDTQRMAASAFWLLIAGMTLTVVAKTRRRRATSEH